MRPRRRQPTRLPRHWDSPDKNTGVGCHFLLQCVKVKSLSRVRLLATSWTTAYQAPPSMGFSRQEYWSGVPSPRREDTFGNREHSWEKSQWWRLYQISFYLTGWEGWDPEKNISNLWLHFAWIKQALRRLHIVLIDFWALQTLDKDAYDISHLFFTLSPGIHLNSREFT